MINDARLRAAAHHTAQAAESGLVIDTSGVREKAMIPQGEHGLTLQKAEVMRVKSTFATDQDGKANKLMFAFTSAMTQPNGEPYEYTVWTGLTFGDHRAALTLLLDMMIPGLVRGMQVKIADLVGKRYRAHIQHRTNPTTGKVYAAHLYILPAEGESAQEQPEALEAPSSANGGAAPIVDRAVKGNAAKTVNPPPAIPAASLVDNAAGAEDASGW